MAGARHPHRDGRGAPPTRSQPETIARFSPMRRRAREAGGHEAGPEGGAVEAVVLEARRSAAACGCAPRAARRRGRSGFRADPAALDAHAVHLDEEGLLHPGRTGCGRRRWGPAGRGRSSGRGDRRRRRARERRPSWPELLCIRASLPLYIGRSARILNVRSGGRSTVAGDHETRGRDERGGDRERGPDADRQRSWAGWRACRPPSSGPSWWPRRCAAPALDPARVDELLMGNVLSAGLGQGPARQVVAAAPASPRRCPRRRSTSCAARA